jgi:hypothetical protein
MIQACDSERLLHKILLTIPVSSLQRQIVAVSPGYITQHGVPQHPHELINQRNAHCFNGAGELCQFTFSLRIVNPKYFVCRKTAREAGHEFHASSHWQSWGQNPGINP